MIQEINKQWFEKRELLKARLDYEVAKLRPFGYLDYEDLVKILFQEVIEGYDLENLIVLDHGDYQGCQVFIIPKDTYQPSVDDYLYTYVYYGSCSGCDTMQGIFDGNNDNEEKVKDLMMLSLHLVQGMKFLEKSEEEIIK